MKLVNRFLLLLFMIMLASACSQKPAQIIHNSNHYYSKNSSYNKNKYLHLNKRGTYKSQQIEVVFGDTLYSISKRYQVPLRDLIKENNLEPPYALFAGTILTIPKPSFHKVQAGETLSEIAQIYNMNASSIVAMNDLKPPYLLQVGQELQVTQKIQPKQTDNVAQSSVTKKPLIIKDNIKDTIKDNKEETPSLLAHNLKKSNKFAWPVNGTVISEFGPKSHGLYNDGINIEASQGTKVKAAEDGTVAYVGNELKGYGNLVIIKHSDGWITAYAHLAQTLVKRGDQVKQNQHIASVGSTGNVKSPQLYFGLRKGRDAVNPAQYLK